MPTNVYECMFLLDSTKVAGDVPAAAKQLEAIFQRYEAEVLASRPWDERRLSFQIGSHKKGQYYLTYFRTEPKNIVNMERDFALNEMILRQLVLKIDPKLVDIMLQVARDEHALALQSVTSNGMDGDGDDMRGDYDRPRGRRRDRDD